MLIIIVRTSGFTNEMSENHFFYSRNFEGIFGSELMVECNLLFLFSTNLTVSNKTMQFLEKFAKVRVRVRVRDGVKVRVREIFKFASPLLHISNKVKKWSFMYISPC